MFLDSSVLDNDKNHVNDKKFDDKKIKEKKDIANMLKKGFFLLFLFIFVIKIIISIIIQGFKKWERSKIMVVGEGRAGKTALTNSIIGKPFVETSSTIGINELTCDIKYASAGAGNLCL